LRIVESDNRRSRAVLENTSFSAGVAIDSWYRAYAGRLRGATKRMLGNADDAEDALQDAFVAAFRWFERYDGGDPYPWLYRIATRKALDIRTARRPRDGGLAAPAAEPSAEDQALVAFSRAELAELLRGEPALALHLVGG
jgi:DNA-directed RNA polymerase specialized sigma24 family protein